MSSQGELAVLRSRGVIAEMESGSSKCKNALAKVGRFAQATQVEICRTCSSVAVREWNEGKRLRDALTGLIINGQFSDCEEIITIFLQQLNNEIDKYQGECVALQAASDIRLAGEAKERASLNKRVTVGIAAGSTGAGVVGGAIGALGGPLGIALGAGLGALIGGAGGGGIAHATAAKK